MPARSSLFTPLGWAVIAIVLVMIGWGIYLWAWR